LLLTGMGILVGTLRRFLAEALRFFSPCRFFRSTSPCRSQMNCAKTMWNPLSRPHARAKCRKDAPGTPVSTSISIHTSSLSQPSSWAAGLSIGNSPLDRRSSFRCQAGGFKSIETVLQITIRGSFRVSLLVSSATKLKLSGRISS